MYADFIAGWVAGGTGLLIGHPLDTVKARLQTIGGYNGIIDCFAKTMKNETLFGLYKGMFLPFVTIGALNSLLYAGYGFGLKLFHPGESSIQARKDLPMREILLASICGTAAQLGPMIPIELVKTRLQVQRESAKAALAEGKQVYLGTTDCVRQIIKTEGVRGLFKGGQVLFLRDSIGYLFYIPVYEGSLRMLRKTGMNETSVQFLSGGMAGIGGWLSICPLEVVKNRVQVDKTGQSQHLWRTINTIYRNEGLRSFYRGGLTISIRGFIVNAVVFVMYENVLEFVEGLSGAAMIG